jgi:hypothetical protein
MEPTKKLIQAVLAGEIETAWGKELREALDEPHNCTKIAAYAVHVIDSANLEEESARTPMLVHGIVENSEFDVPKFHAWAEVGDTVIDLTLPSLVHFASKDQYYALKGIETTRRYTAEEVSINLIRFGHYGPWDDEAFADQSLFR